MLITPPSRPTPLGCILGFFGFLLSSVTIAAGIASWLAYLRPEKKIDWLPLALLTAGFLSVTLLVCWLAWKRIKNGGSIEPFNSDSSLDL